MPRTGDTPGGNHESAMLPLLRAHHRLVSNAITTESRIELMSTPGESRHEKTPTPEADRAEPQ